MTTADLVAFIRKNPIVCGCGLFAVLLAVLTYFRSEALPLKAAELEDKATEGTRLANNVRYGAQLAEQLAALTAAGKAVDGHIVRSAELANNLQYFYRLEADTGAKIIELRQNPSPPSSQKSAPKSTYVGISFTVSLRGEYPVILDFLRRLENGQHYCRVTSASVAPVGPDRATPLKLALGLELLGQP